MEYLRGQEEISLFGIREKQLLAVYPEVGNRLLALPGHQPVVPPPGQIMLEMRVFLFGEQ